jgi:uncharacterized SAM-binding protein YcdF (DUF218 family)
MNALKRFFTVLSASVILFFFLWIGGFVVFTGSVAAMKEPRTVETTDGIIALTGGTNRVTRALDLMQNKKAKGLLVSGVNPNVRLRELLGLHDTKLETPCCITLGRMADNTIGNANEARDWVNANSFKSIRIVTANYHMPRALLEFHHALPDVAIIPHPILPQNFSPRTVNYWKLCFTEYHKFLVTLIRIIFYPHATSPLPAEMKQ